MRMIARKGQEARVRLFLHKSDRGGGRLRGPKLGDAGVCSFVRDSAGLTATDQPIRPAISEYEPGAPACRSIRRPSAVAAPIALLACPAALLAQPPPHILKGVPP